jgi:type I restriction enzyme S subunit
MIGETVSLGEVCEILDTLRKPITKKFRIQGQYPYYGATGIVDYVDNYIFDETLVLIGEDGAKWDKGDQTAFIVSGKYWVNNHAHVIRPLKNKLNQKFLVYYLNSIDLKPWVTGLTVPKLNQEKLKSIPIPLFTIDEQQRIIAKLDAAFTEIDNSLETLKKNTKNVKYLYDMALSSMFETLRTKFKTVPIADSCDNIFAGGDIPKSSLSKTKTKKYTVPIYANAKKQKGLYGFTDKPRVNVPAVTVAGRGSGTGYTEIRMKPFFPIVRLIVLMPNLKRISIEYLKSVIISLNLKSVGSAIPQLTIPMIKGYKIPIPTLNEQANIIKRLDAIEIISLKLSSIYSKKILYYEALKLAIFKRELQKEAA